MKIRQYIVTYNNEMQINKCLHSLFDSISAEESNMLEVFVINNHTNFSLHDDFKNRVTVLHNNLRSDFSTGHLSRNWNQALINGFESLRHPVCDIVVTNQDDTKFAPNYIHTLLELHSKYALVQFGWGDNFISYTPRAVKRIGLWDERFCSIAYQEADYLLRSALFLRDEVSINDPSHNRVLNKARISPITVVPSGNMRGELYHRAATVHHSYNEKLFNLKWGYSPITGFPTEFNVSPQIQSFILYPYFENDIETLSEQNYHIINTVTD